MRVAIVADVTPGILGGARTFQEDVLEAMLGLAAGSGHAFGLVGLTEDQLPGDAVLPDNVTCLDGGGLLQSTLLRALRTAVPGLGFAARALGLPSGLDRRLARWGADLVWFVTPLWLDTDLPYFYTVWDLQHRRQPWFPEVSGRGRWALREAMFREAIQRATRVIVPNEAARLETERFYGVLAERCLTLAQPTPAFALAGATSAPPSPALWPLLDREFLLYPAQFWPHKNHVTLLRALRLLRDRHGREIHAVLPGTDAGNLEHVREQAQALQIGQQVHLPGFVSRDDLVHLYRRALALTFPSFFGPENLPPLEAMALGCPVIAADVAGARDQLGEAALLVDPTSPEAWVEAIMSALDPEPLRSRLVAAGRARALSWTATDYARAVVAEIQRFARVRACWPGARDERGA